MFKIIEEKRDMLKEQLRAGYDEEVKKKLYYLHIYHTVRLNKKSFNISHLRFVTLFFRLELKATL